MYGCSRVVALLWVVTITQQCRLSIVNDRTNLRLKVDLGDVEIFNLSRRNHNNNRTSRSRGRSRRKLDPEVTMNASQLITSKGIACERHQVTTRDGYVLGMQRLPHHNSTHRYPVLIIHGLLSSSDAFLLNLRNESLAYILYDRGFDVWLGNVRGNKYSRRHTSLDPDQRDFWQWNFDQIGQYDLPAMIGHVLRVTGRSKLNYIGYSQGTVVLMSSVMQNGAAVGDQIANFFALAPAAYVPNMKSPLRHLLSVSDLIQRYNEFFNHDEFLRASVTVSTWMGKFCSSHPKWCEMSLFWLVGRSRRGNLNRTRLPVLLSHDPSGTSNQNMLHWAQMLMRRSVGMTYYDYGSFWMNFYRYGRFTPPEYDFSQFRVATYMFCGRSDTLVTLGDCRKLSRIVPNLRAVVTVKGYSHADFIFASNGMKNVYGQIIRHMTSRP